MDDAELAALRASGALAETRRTPPPAVGSPGARRTPSVSALAAVEQPAGQPAGQPARPPRGDALPARSAAVPAAVDLVLSSGERIPVAGRGVIGRDPAEAPGAYAHRVALADTEKLLSRAHLEYGVDGTGAFWVADLHSTNGVLVERVGQAPQRCLPGYRVAIQPGDRVVFGGRILTIEAH